MFHPICPRRAEKILDKYRARIKWAADTFLLPAALIRAVLYQEMTAIDLWDAAADVAVLLKLPGKKDSSTGYGQIFGRVGLQALNYAVDRGLTGYEAWGFGPGHRLRAEDPKDVRRVWKKLFISPDFNIAATAMNLLSATEEMTGRQDPGQCTAEEIQLVLSRYNANTRHITAYGKSAYGHYLRYLGEESARGAGAAL